MGMDLEDEFEVDNIVAWVCMKRRWCTFSSSKRRNNNTARCSGVRAVANSSEHKAGIFFMRIVQYSEGTIALVYVTTLMKLTKVKSSWARWF